MRSSHTVRSVRVRSRDTARRGARLAAAALVVTMPGACGAAGSGSSNEAASTGNAPSVTVTVTNPDGSTGAPPATTSRSVLPDVIVRDVATGAEMPLASLVPAERPLLVWFWAPH
jgi:hypothetical protein